MSQWMSMNVPEVEALRRRLDAVEMHLRRTFPASQRAQRYAYTAFAAERMRAEGKPARRLPEFKSQYGEDLLLFDLFEGKTDGFFLEAGAFNGVDFSATYVFEQIGWSGLLVEPIPERAEECRVNRPYSRVVHAALGSPGDPDTATLHFTQDQYGGMLSFVHSGGDHHNNMAASAIPRTQISVPQVTLDSILATAQTRIDLAILDVEANEVRVLAGFNLGLHRPRVLVIEDGSLGRNAPLHAAVTAHPYTLVGWGGENAIYILNGEESLRRRWAEMSRP